MSLRFIFKTNDVELVNQEAYEEVGNRCEVTHWYQINVIRLASEILKCGLHSIYLWFLVEMNAMDTNWLRANIKKWIEFRNNYRVVWDLMDFHNRITYQVYLLFSNSTTIFFM